MGLRRIFSSSPRNVLPGKCVLVFYFIKKKQTNFLLYTRMKKKPIHLPIVRLFICFLKVCVVYVRRTIFYYKTLFTCVCESVCYSYYTRDNGRSINHTHKYIIIFLFFILKQGRDKFVLKDFFLLHERIENLSFSGILFLILYRTKCVFPFFKRENIFKYFSKKEKENPSDENPKINVNFSWILVFTTIK